MLYLFVSSKQKENVDLNFCTTKFAMRTASETQNYSDILVKFATKA